MLHYPGELWGVFFVVVFLIKPNHNIKKNPFGPAALIGFHIHVSHSGVQGELDLWFLKMFYLSCGSQRTNTTNRTLSERQLLGLQLQLCREGGHSFEDINVHILDRCFES